MANFLPQNAPRELDLNTFKAKLDGYGSVAKGCRFAVRILPAGTGNLLSSLGYNSFMQDLTFVCESADFPGRGFDVTESRYYGAPFLLPRNTKYEAANLAFICRTDSMERQLFDDWLELINPTNIWDFNYAKQYYCKIEIFQFAEFGEPGRAQNGAGIPKPVYQWNLWQAWPMLVAPQQVTWAETDILRLSVTFAYRYWSRPGRDADPTGGEITLTPQ